MKANIKRIFKYMGIVIISVCVLIVGVLYYFENYHIEEVDRKYSENQEYMLILQRVGSTKWSFGPTDARLILMKNNETIEKYDFVVYADGGMTEHCWDVAWNEEFVEIIFPDRKLVKVIMYYDGAETFLSEED